jgi:electron transport complex protein RnfG
MSKETSSFTMITRLALIATISGVLIVSAFQFTLPTIKKNKAIALKQAVFEVIPGSSVVKTFIQNGEKFEELVGENENALKYYVGYDDSNQIIGVAIEASGQGFVDIIKVLYGYNGQKEQIVGMKVLETKETPGLGDKIEKDPAFRANFNDLDVRLDETKTKLLHDIEVTKTGKKTDKWQIDGITGATISSVAIGKILQGSASERLPIVYKLLSQIEGDENGK